jgi:homoserine O-succinyltransferase
MQALLDHPPSREVEISRRDDDPIVIGLVNNMPDAALLSTERQFRELLSAPSHGPSVRLELFALPEIPRTETGRSHVRRHYHDISALWASHVDGLIVTGTTPSAPALADEPYWSTMTRLVDWAENRTVSTVWSCLAAHVAVLHDDGVNRQALEKKLSGVFDCMKVADHAMLAGAPRRWRVPHSRYNELPEAALVSSGYQILSRSPEAGVDMFVKQRKSLFLFLQGHPEYHPAALLREYRRDVGRFLARACDTYPEMPCGYFDETAAAELAAFRRLAVRQREIDLLASFPTAAAAGTSPHPWHRPAADLYANWLSYLAEHRSPARTSADFVRRFA